MWALQPRYNFHHLCCFLDWSLLEKFLSAVVLMLSENFFLKIVVYLEWSICRPVTRRIAVGSSKEENSLQSASSSEAIEFDKLFFQGGLEHPPECA
jgi:hypothetical protein